MSSLSGVPNTLMSGLVARQGDFRLYPADECRSEIGYEPLFWPWSRLLGLEGPAGSTSYGTFRAVGGSRTWWRIAGVARDAYNSPIIGATVKLFRTADDTRQDQATADGNGGYTLYTGYTDGHYVVGFASGAPMVQGATVNTLVGV